jgi:hypothetical protein
MVYSDRYQLGAGLQAIDQQLPIRPDADFILRGFSLANLSGSVGVRLRRPDGSWFIGPDFVHSNLIAPNDFQAVYTPIFPELRYPAASMFKFDLLDLGGAGDLGIYPVLWGVERYEDNALPAAAYPARYREEPYDDEIRVTIAGANAMQMDIPVRCRTGDAWAVRELAWTYNDLNGATVTQTLHVRIKDAQGKTYTGGGANGGWVPMRCIFGGPSDSPYAMTPFPELVVPANGALYLDVWNRFEAGSYDVRLGFRGVRFVAF